MDSAKEVKWQGKSKAKITGYTADQVWSLLQNFLDIHKYLPTIDTCRHVSGRENQPLCVRYCSRTISPGGSGCDFTAWVTEKLLEFDPHNMFYTYEIVANNMGFGSYQSTFQVSSASTGNGCVLEWSFDAAPVQSWSLDLLISYIETNVKAIAKNVEEALRVRAKP